MNDHQIITGLIGAAANEQAISPAATRWATEALALAADLPALIEEAEGILGRIDHDLTCAWCAGIPAALLPLVGSYWCVH